MPRINILMDKKKILIKILVEISRVILGIVFIFSGFVKAVDPYGTAYKITDYLTAFHFSSLSFLSLPGSVLQSAIEFAMGACMLFGLYRRWNSRLMLVVMIFMTVLTLYLAISNPVEDCGCFGDALIITNWQTFYKNVILLICSLIVFKYHECISNLFTGKTYWLAFLYIFIFIGSFIFYNYLYDPIFDFRPYKIGTNIRELKDIDEGKGREEQMTLIYSKDGIEKKFSEDNYPWEDSTWVFVRMETETIKEGDKSPIKDFVINKLSFNQNRTEILRQEDITTEVLNYTGYVFLMISPSLEDMNSSYLSNFEDVENYANDNDYLFYCITASTTDEIINWAKENTIDFEFCTMDGRALKTIMRSNPGLILLKDGVVIDKWADVDVPAEKDLNKPLAQLSYGQMIDTKKEDKSNLFYICFLFVIPLLGLKCFDFLLFRKKKAKQNEDINNEE